MTREINTFRGITTTKHLKKECFSRIFSPSELTVVICHMHAEEDTTALNSSETFAQVFLIYIPAKGNRLRLLLCHISLLGKN